ncbi:MAG: hypothetical protein ACD_8C00138G0004 [uncultured bacterium]|nr:MAG: hypothetical protein ACD_8C00138G0004 [uncultured bacterium]
MGIVQQARNFVQDQCKKPASHYSAGIFEGHLVPMESIADGLAIKFGADREIVGVGVWLHDAGSIICGRDDHHLTGAAITEVVLRMWGYPEVKIHKVKGCVLSHRGSQKIAPKTLEEQIVAEADALSAFYNLSGLFKGAFDEGKNQREAEISIRKKLINKWNQLLFLESKESVQSRFKAAMELLDA